MDATSRSGNVGRMRLAGIAGLALWWLAGVSRVLAITITVAIPTNTQIVGIEPNESGGCLYGETVTVSAQVTPIAGITAPTGTVQFLIAAGDVVGSASLVPSSSTPASIATTSAVCAPPQPVW